MQPNKLTSQRLDRIRAAAADGESDSQIASTLGMSRTAVEKLRLRYEIPSRWKPPPSVHGVYSTYTNGCRCEPCREANTEYARCRRARRLMLTLAGTAPDHAHGNGGYTNWGCRCEVCSAGHAVVQARKQ